MQHMTCAVHIEFVSDLNWNYVNNACFTVFDWVTTDHQERQSARYTSNSSHQVLITLATETMSPIESKQLAEN